LLDLGCYISFSGLVTFKSAIEVSNAAKYVPLDRLLVETDSPYLSPHPLRGKTNYPKNVIAGNPPERLYFRNGDNFTEVADLFNQAMERLEEDRSNDFQYLSEVSSYIKNLSVVVPEDKKPVLNEIILKLNEIQLRFDSKSDS